MGPVILIPPPSQIVVATFSAITAIRNTARPAAKTRPWWKVSLSSQPHYVSAERPRRIGNGVRELQSRSSLGEVVSMPVAPCLHHYKALRNWLQNPPDSRSLCPGGSRLR
jgi:hypothetical protein